MLHRHVSPTVARLTMLAVAAAIGLGTTLALSGCHTMEGAGEDIESVGEGIDSAVD